MGIDGLLDNLQWLPLHYNWLRSRPPGPVAQAWLPARPISRRPATRDCRILLTGVHLLGMGTLQACISWACVSYRRASLWHLLSMHLYRGTSLTARIS
jgi:hypothetical protein